MNMSKEIFEALTQPFDPKEVEVKVQAVSKDRSRAQVVAYVDARAVLDRLDEVVGPAGWSDSYEVLSNTSGEEGRIVEVKCSLTVLGTTKEDVGEGNSLKAAFSDALKRAAVKFGISRYLYRLPKVWADLDEKGNIKSPEAVKRLLLGEADGVLSREDRPQQAREVKPQARDNTGSSQSQPGGVTEAQLRYIYKLWKAIASDGDEINEYASAILGRDVSDIKGLSRQEASTLIENMKGDAANS